MCVPFQRLQEMLNSPSLCPFEVTTANDRQTALKERGIDKMLEEAREDHKEHDATNLGKRCRMPYHKKPADFAN